MSAARLPRGERLSLAGPAGALELLVETPVDEGGGEPSEPRAFAVVCHPHPLQGGTLDNKVVWTLARAFEQLGAPAIRFNFRGVGASAGVYDEGRGETEDVLRVIAYGRERWPGAALWLAGFSFGGVIALRAAAREPCERVVLVAPGITRIDAGGVGAPECPMLIVQGDADDVVPAPTVLFWAKTLHPAPTVTLLVGAGHFFHGRTLELRDAVLGFMGAEAAT